MSALTIDDVLRVVDGKRGQGPWVARCPAHEDRNPSLSIRVATDGKPLWKCFAGCAQEDVTKALLARMGSNTSSVMADRRERIVAEYNYHDEESRPLYQVVRFEPKSFAARRPDGRGGWIFGLAPGCRHVPYLRILVHSDHPF
jgi:hypothetical protein